MSCFGGRGGEEKAGVSDQQKWDYINLSDFRSSNCATVMSYMWLWSLVFVAIAVYAADTFTAVRLLGFNEWSSQVKPSIPFAISKWIFAVCIILSWTILIFEWIRALRVMARNCVSDDYLDPLAVKLQSMRWGTGWRRFLVFAELTKSKKKVTWIAIYVYFQRKGAIRLLLADGPRQVVNALTLYSVAKAKLVTDDPKDGRSTIGQFFDNLEILANANKTQTIILSTMSFTLVIWVVSMLMLMLALVLYLFFLWHHIHNETLNGFCRRKIETRLERIVKAKTEKIWAKQQAKRAKEEAKMGKSGKSNYKSDDKLPEFAQPGRQPTLPSLDDSPKSGELMRTDSIATLPPYTSKPGTPLNANPPPLPRQPTLPDLGRPTPPSRSFTGSTVASNVSYGSSTNLLASAEPMGYFDRPQSPAVSYPGKPAPYNANSGRSYGPPLTTPSNDPRFPPPTRTNSGFSAGSRNSPLSAMSASSQDYLLGPELSRPGTTAPGGGGQRRSPLIPVSPYGDRVQSPASGGSYEMGPMGGGSGVPSSATDDIMGDYFGSSHPPPQASRTPAPRPHAYGPPTDMPRRDFSAPPMGAPGGMGRSQTPGRNFAYPMQPQRSATAPVPDYVRQGPQRSATAGPGEQWR